MRAIQGSFYSIRVIDFSRENLSIILDPVKCCVLSDHNYLFIAPEMIIKKLIKLWERKAFGLDLILIVFGFLI